ncbi:hypothetical protein J7L13_00190 [bacterium]|nr:hypothetical protein [bacterium]
MITIDFDKPGKTDLDMIFFVLRLKNICDKKRCFIGESHKGYHVYIMGINSDKDGGLRALLMDDPARLWFDDYRIYKNIGYWRNTLFSVKNNGDYLSKEKSLSLKDFMHNILYLDDSFVKIIHRNKTRKMMGGDN